jgi:hypothetical protein
MPVHEAFGLLEKGIVGALAYRDRDKRKISYLILVV